MPMITGTSFRLPATQRQTEDDSDSDEELAVVFAKKQYKCCIHPYLDMTEAEIKAAFDKFDSDGSGGIDKSEVKTLMCELYGEKLGNRLTRKMMKHDKDGDGELSYEEFKSFVATRRAERKLTVAEMVYITFDNPGRFPRLAIQS